GVSRVEDFLARHHVAADEAQVLDAEGHRLVPREFLQIAATHHGLDPRQRPRLFEIDRFDACVGMGAAQTLAPEHAGPCGVGTKGGPAGPLSLAIGPVGTLADPLVVRTVCRHRCSLFHCVASIAWLLLRCFYSVASIALRVFDCVGPTAPPLLRGFYSLAAV